MADIEMAAVIDKADISPLGKLKGSSNASPVTVAGEEFAVGKLRFAGFSGSTTRANRKRFHGVFRFDRDDGSDHANRKHFDFLKPKTSSLAGERAKPAQSAKPAKDAKRAKREGL